MILMGQYKNSSAHVQQSEVWIKVFWVYAQKEFIKAVI